MDELATERRALADFLDELGFRPILFEDLGGRDENAETAYLAGVAQAEIYLGLVGERYGTMLPSGRSPTHEEYRKARELGRRVSVWSREPSPERQGNARDFLAEVQVFNTTGRFRGTDDLLAAVKRRLGEIAADDEAPWVKLGEAVFRVERIRDEGARVVLDAMVRDPALARYLEGMRPDQWQRGGGGVAEHPRLLRLGHCQVGGQRDSGAKRPQDGDRARGQLERGPREPDGGRNSGLQRRRPHRDRA